MLSHRKGVLLDGIGSELVRASTGGTRKTLSAWLGDLSNAINLGDVASTFTSGDATPSVLNNSKFITAGSTAITNFDDGVEGQTITIYRGNANISITDNATIDPIIAGDITLTTARPSVTFRLASGVWKQVEEAGAISTAMLAPVQAATLVAGHTALGSTIYPISAYSNDLDAAITAAAAGGGRVIVDRDINVASTITPKNDVQVLLYPGVVLTWTGGSAVMFQSASNDVLNRFSIMGYGATLALGSSCTGALKLYGPYRCAFWGFEITGSLTTSVAIDVRGDSSAGTNPIGNRNGVYCSFGDIVHSGTCGRFIRLYGEGTDGVSATYPVVLNTFHNMHCEDARVIGIDFARWADHNFFTGITRIGIVGNNSVGVSYNSVNPTVNCGVYTNHFDALAVDSFNTYTGRVGLALNNCKDVLIDHFYNYPLAEGGAYTIASTAASYVIRYFNEALGLMQYLSKGEQFAGNDAAAAVSQDIKNYDTGTSAAQWRAISGAATGATNILSAVAGIGYTGTSSNHPVGIISNNVERIRFETSGTVQLKTAGAAIIGEADGGNDLGTTAVGWRAAYLTDGLYVDDVRVVKEQGAAIANLAWTYTANDPGTTPNSATTFADGTALVAATVYEAFDEIEGKLNAILAALRTHGLIAT